MEKLFLIVIFISGIFNESTQNEKKVSIYLEEYNHIFTPQKIDCADTLERKLDDGRTLKIILFDCKGKMRIECYNGKKKTEEGDYINSLDLLKKYNRSVNALSGKQMIVVKEYYQPLRSGDWLFYNSKGKLVDNKKYLNGVLVK